LGTFCIVAVPERAVIVLQGEEAAVQFADRVRSPFDGVLFEERKAPGVAGLLPERFVALTHLYLHSLNPPGQLTPAILL
jgi:hypothetical protein